MGGKLTAICIHTPIYVQLVKISFAFMAVDFFEFIFKKLQLWRDWWIMCSRPYFKTKRIMIGILYAASEKYTERVGDS